VSVESAILQFSIEKFRSYETGAAAGGSSTETSGANTEHSQVQQSSTPFSWAARNCDVANTWYDLGGSFTPTTSADGMFVECHVRADKNGSSPMVTIRLKDETNTLYYPNENGIFSTFNDQDTEDNFIGQMWLFHVPGNPADNTYDFDVKADVAGTQVQVTGAWWSISTHTHDVDLPDHTHGMTYDMYEASYSNPSISIKINGTDRTTALGGPWTSDQDDIDIAAYLNIGDWNKIELVPNQLLRLNASVIATAVV